MEWRELIKQHSILLIRLDTPSQNLKYQTYMLMLQKENQTIFTIPCRQLTWSGQDSLTSQTAFFSLGVNSVRTTIIFGLYLVGERSRLPLQAQALRACSQGWSRFIYRISNPGEFHVERLLMWAPFVGVSCKTLSHLKLPLKLLDLSKLAQCLKRLARYESVPSFSMYADRMGYCT